ncbi:MAG: outer membrane protein transport protein [Melioribacteraceae bacterium]|nr:outer membrane protein transport protein [Melioribacteraceae bacterium]
MKKLLIVLLFCSTAFSSIRAGGFQINEHGAKAMAMAGAFVALANDPSAIHFNPAGLTQLHGTQIMFGTTAIMPSAAFRGPSPSTDEYEVESAVFTPINFYVSHQLSDKISVGLGVNNPFGLGTTWTSGWPGETLALDTEIRTFFFTGAVAYKVTEALSIGGSFRFAYGDVLINRNIYIAPFAGTANVDLSGDGTGFGYSLSMLYKKSDKFSFGMHYQSEVVMTFEGDAVTEGPAALASAYPKGGIEAQLTTPSNLLIGVAFKPADQWTVTYDFQWIGWSSYDKLEVKFLDMRTSDGTPLVSSAVRDYNDTYIIRGGVEYQFSEKLALRGGLLYDNNPVNDALVEPTLPDADRIGLNIGAGYKITDNITVDFAYLFLRFDEREVTNSASDINFNGVYNSSAHLAGLNLSFGL